LIEQAMYFALGFLIAGLFTLMFLPAFWRRAMRLSMRRLQALAPMSMEEVIAERDLLRADFALRERRMEQELASVKASKARDLVDVGRHAARIFDLDTRLKTSQAETREAEARLRDALKLVDERTDLLSSTEAALHELTERGETHVARLRTLEADKQEVARQSQEHQSRVVMHETKIADLHRHNGDLERDLAQLREAHAQLAAEKERLVGVDANLANMTMERDALLTERLRLSDTLDKTHARFDALEKRLQDEVTHLENALRLARAEARDHADRAETARSDNSMLQGAVEALRNERAAARQALISKVGAPAVLASGVDADEVAALRAAIVDIGMRMTGLAAQSTPEAKLNALEPKRAEA
jgi:chromosome segregation ATPase